MALDLSAFGVKKEEELSSKPKKRGLDLSAFGVEEPEEEQITPVEIPKKTTPKEKPKSLGEFLRGKGYRDQRWAELEKQGKMTPTMKRMERAGFSPPITKKPSGVPGETLIETSYKSYSIPTAPKTMPKIGVGEVIKYLPGEITKRETLTKGVSQFFKSIGKEAAKTVLGLGELALNLYPRKYREGGKEVAKILRKHLEVKDISEIPGRVVESLGEVAIGTGLARQALTKVPTISRFATRFPKLFNALSLGTTGTLLGQIKEVEDGDWKKRLKQAAIDFPTWTLWGLTGNIPATQPYKYFPAYFTLGYTSAKLEGQTQQNALIAGLSSGVIGGLLHLASVPKKTENIVKQQADKVLKKYGIKNKADYLKAMHKYHPDKSKLPQEEAERISAQITTAWNVRNKLPQELEKGVMQEMRELYRMMTRPAIPAKRALIVSPTVPEVLRPKIPKKPPTIAEMEKRIKYKPTNKLLKIPVMKHAIEDMGGTVKYRGFADLGKKIIEMKDELPKRNLTIEELHKWVNSKLTPEERKKAASSIESTLNGLRSASQTPEMEGMFVSPEEARKAVSGAVSKPKVEIKKPVEVERKKTPKVAYHGTDKRIAEIIKKEGFKLKELDKRKIGGLHMGHGIYLTPNLKEAKYWANYKEPKETEILKIYISPKAKIKTLSYDEAVRIRNKISLEGQKRARERGKFYSVAQGAEDFRNYWIKQGYDGLQIKNKFDKEAKERYSNFENWLDKTGGNELVIYNPKVIKIEPVVKGVKEVKPKIKNELPVKVDEGKILLGKKHIGAIVAVPEDWGEGRFFLIHHFEILPEYRGKRIGTEVIKIIEKQAKQQGIKRIEARVPDEGVAKFYKKQGYTIEKTRMSPKWVRLKAVKEIKEVKEPKSAGEIFNKLRSIKGAKEEAKPKYKRAKIPSSEEKKMVKDKKKTAIISKDEIEVAESFGIDLTKYEPEKARKIVNDLANIVVFETEFEDSILKGRISKELKEVAKDYFDPKKTTPETFEIKLDYAEQMQEYAEMPGWLGDRLRALQRAMEINKETRKKLKPPKPKYKRAEIAPFTGFKDITTKILNQLKGKTLVSKQFIQDLTRREDIKQAEKDIINEVLKEYPEGEKIPVKEFADKVKTQLLPLELNKWSGRYENITLPSGLRGNIANYSEHIYESPIKTSAGDVHFDTRMAPNYFAHTRVEDLANKKTRRIIEIQSDLFQKGRLEEEVKSLPGFIGKSAREQIKIRAKYLSPEEAKEYLLIYQKLPSIKGKLWKKLMKRFHELSRKADENIAKAREPQFAKLLPYRNTWHERIIREEIKRAAQDEKVKLQFPTGETAMKIEGLGETEEWYKLPYEKKLTIDNMKVGDVISRMDVYGRIPEAETEHWIITDILGDGKFKAVPKDRINTLKEFYKIDKKKVKDFYGEKYTEELLEKERNRAKKALNEEIKKSAETFDISGKVDTSNPIYKFYESKVGKYLKKKYGAKRITDPQGVTWWEVDIKPEMAEEPVLAYKKADERIRFDITPQEANKILRRFFDETEVRFMAEKRIRDENGLPVFGKYYQALIEVVKRKGKVSSFVVYHEAFHRAMELFEPEKRKDYLDAYRKMVGEKMTDEEAEEGLADLFAETMTKKRTLPAKIWFFFKRLLNRIKKWIGKENKILEAFDRIISRRRPEKGVVGEKAFAKHKKEITTDEMIKELAKTERYRNTPEELAYMTKPEIRREYARLIKPELLSLEQYKETEKNTYKFAVKNEKRLIKEYESKFGNFLGGDNVKELFPEYRENRSRYAAFREGSNYLWRKIFNKWLKEKRGTANNMVLILIGGPAVGKTVSAKDVLGKDYRSKYSFVIETTGHDKKLFEKLVKKIIDNGFLVRIEQIYTDIDKAFIRSLKRAQENGGLNDGKGRTVYIPEFVKRHLGALEIGREYVRKYSNPTGKIYYRLIVNTGKPGTAKEYPQLGALAFLNKVRYNKDDEQKLIKRYYEKAIQSFNRGRISKAVYEGTTGLLGSPEERERGKREINSASVKPRAEAPRENRVEEKAEETKERTAKTQPPTSGEEAVFVVPKKLEQLAKRIEKAESIDKLRKEIIKEGKAIEISEELRKKGMNLGEFWAYVKGEEIKGEVEAEPTKEELEEIFKGEIMSAEEFEKEEGKKLFRDIREHGGLKTPQGMEEEMSDIPIDIKRKDGFTPDEMIQELNEIGYNFESGDDLIEAIKKVRTMPSRYKPAKTTIEKRIEEMKFLARKMPKKTKTKIEQKIDKIESLIQTYSPILKPKGLAEKVGKVYKGIERAKEGEEIGSIPRLETILRAIERGQESAAKALTKKEKKQILDEVKNIKEEIISYAKERLNPEDRKALLATIKNATTPKHLDKAKKFIEKLKARAEKRQAIRDFRKHIKKLNLEKMRPEYRRKIEEILADIDIANTSAKKLNKLASTKRYLEQHPDNIIPQEVLDQLEVLDKKPLKKMTAEEIRLIDDSIRHLVHLEKLKNSLIFGKTLRNMERMVNEAVEHIRRKPSKVPEDEISTVAKVKKVGPIGWFRLKSLNMDTITYELDYTPKEYGLDEIVKEVVNNEIDEKTIIGELIYRGISKGVREQLKFEQETEDFFNKRMKEAGIKDVSTWSKLITPEDKKIREKLHIQKELDLQKIKLPSGKTITLTKAERVSLMLHLRHPDNLKHLLKGGFSFYDKKFIIHKLSLEDYQAIANSATPEEKKMVEIVNEYLNDFAKKRGNEVSMDLNGFELLKIKENYFPIRTNSVDIKRDRLKLKANLTPETLGNFTQQTLEGMGIFKERKHTSEAIILEDVFEVIARHRKQLGAYIGLAKPLRNAKALVYNKQFRMQVSLRYGETYWKELANYINDIEQRSYNTDELDRLALHLINKLDPAILGFNPWIMMKQIPSYLYEAIEMDLKYMKPLKVLGPETIEEMKKYSPELRDRLQGRVTRELGEVANVGEIRRMFTGKVPFSNKILAGIRNFDKKVIARIWEDVKREVKGKYPELKGDQYWEVVARRVEQIVNRSQPTFHPKDRSAIGRSRSPFVRVLTKYTTQRNKILNMIERERIRYNRSRKTLKDKMRFIRAMFILIFVSSLLIEGINESRRIVFRKKPSSIWRFALNTIGNALSYVYFVGDSFQSLVSKIDKGTYAGWDYSNIVAEFVDTAINAIAETTRAIEQAMTHEKYKAGSKKGEEKWKTSAKKAIEAAGDVLGGLTGIPFRTTRKMIESGYEWTTGKPLEWKKKEEKKPQPLLLPKSHRKKLYPTPRSRRKSLYPKRRKLPALTF